MAQTILILCASFLFSISVLTQKAMVMATEFKVGGLNGWVLPSDPYTNSFNQWAERNRFLVGDSLVFVYAADKDSVLYVSQNDYLSCNVSNPLQKFTDGHTVIKLEHSGPFYFISGVRDNCLKNEKLSVIVLADRTKNATPPPETSAAPPPSSLPPPPSPSAEAPPSPAPAGETPPSPPPTNSSGGEINPSPAPSEETKPAGHKNAASSSNVKSYFVLMAAFLGSSLLTVV